MFDHMLLVLAQEGQVPADGPPQDMAPRIPIEDAGGSGHQPIESQPVDEIGSRVPDGRSQSNPLVTLMPFILIIALFWFVMMGGQRREKKKRAKMLAMLAKGHRVQTVGGILGTVVEVRDQEIVVKVDENANTRLHFTRSAIQSVTENGSD